MQLPLSIARARARYQFRSTRRFIFPRLMDGRSLMANGGDEGRIRLRDELETKWHKIAKRNAPPRGDSRPRSDFAVRHEQKFSSRVASRNGADVLRLFFLRPAIVFVRCGVRGSAREDIYPRSRLLIYSRISRVLLRAVTEWTSEG
jgi:hypothetical protein